MQYMSTLNQCERKVSRYCALETAYTPQAHHMEVWCQHKQPARLNRYRDGCRNEDGDITEREEDERVGEMHVGERL
jgi:hypothetical protein